MKDGGILTWFAVVVATVLCGELNAFQASPVISFRKPLCGSINCSQGNGKERTMALHVSPKSGSEPASVMRMAETTVTAEALHDSVLNPVPLPELEPPVKQTIHNRADPFAELSSRVAAMDINAIVNTAVIVVCVVAVLSKLATVDSGMMRGWTASEIAYRIPVDNWDGYSDILDKAPVSTKAITSASVYTIGDFISQKTEGKTMGELDRGRIVRSLLAGLIGHGPLSHIWYDWSEGLFNDVLHWTAWWSFFPKVILDQATWGPFWNNTYILLLGLMKMETWESIWRDMKRTTIPLVVSGLKLWPLAHCVTYGLVPVENRLLWVDLVEIVWVTILATQASGSHAVDTDTNEDVKQSVAAEALR